MARALYYYTKIELKTLERLAHGHQENFDNLLEEHFSQEEIERFESKLESLSSLIVQPIISELTFDDFEADPDLEAEQREFFDSCRSCICLDHLPDLESNPFQVSYLKHLLSLIPEVLVDQGAMSELMFKDKHIKELSKMKDMDQLIMPDQDKFLIRERPVILGPIDQVLKDVYQELDRIQRKGLDSLLEAEVGPLPDKMKTLFAVTKKEKIDSIELFRRSGLIPKDFGDYLERLKFFLKRIQ